MANIIRRENREPLSLRDAMDRLFDDSFLAPFGSTFPSFGLAGAPAVDVCETDNDVIVTATVPGIKPDDLKITLTGDLLEISGEARSETERKDATYHVRERSQGSFSRAITLPTSVLTDKAQAEFDNGVLTLTLPKAEEARRKTITVKPKVIKAK
jgi:HSP20 family protein